MINVEELIGVLQSKITHYRDVQQSAWRVRGCIKVGREDLSRIRVNLKGEIADKLDCLQKQMVSSVMVIGQFYEGQMSKQKRIYEQEIYEISNEISRQHQVITFLKRDLEDLMMMLNLREEQKYQSGREQSEQRSRDNQRQQGQNQEGDRAQTINGLEIIEEQETDRTLLSSARSCREQQSVRHKQNFIRIENAGEEEENDNYFVKRQFGQSEVAQLKPNPSQSEIENHFKSLQKPNSNDDCFSSQRSNLAKLQQIMDSNTSKAPNPSIFDINTQENYGQYDCNTQGINCMSQFSREQIGLWQCKFNSKQLKDITNESVQSEQDRQSKTKMFLEEFRKTFNKCLSSSEIPRKLSAKTNQSSKKSTSRQEKSRKTNNRQIAVPSKIMDSDRSDSHKLINEMLRDIDNNNKFSVGHRKTELRYEGEKRDNLRSGQGILYYSNGLCYQGEFKNNLRHGNGVLRFNQIDIYKGEWIGDQLSGKGKIRNFAVINKKKSQTNNSPLLKWISYFGFFKNNRFEGEGTLYLQGGEKFLGKFICGMACGQGTLYKKNGEVQNGIWRNNQIVEQF